MTNVRTQFFHMSLKYFLYCIQPSIYKYEACLTKCDYKVKKFDKKYDTKCKKNYAPNTSIREKKICLFDKYYTLQ